MSNRRGHILGIIVVIVIEISVSFNRRLIFFFVNFFWRRGYYLWDSLDSLWCFFWTFFRNNFRNCFVYFCLFCYDCVFLILWIFIDKMRFFCCYDFFVECSLLILILYFLRSNISRKRLIFFQFVLDLTQSKIIITGYIFPSWLLKKYFTRRGEMWVVSYLLWLLSFDEYCESKCWCLGRWTLTLRGEALSCFWLWVYFNLMDWNLWSLEFWVFPEGFIFF